MKVTIYDVAEKAGVSIATVSKVINNTGNMRDTTRQKVMKVMEELNYFPSVMASALTGKKTQTLGLLVPDISNPFFSEMARTIEDRAHERGLSVIMCSTDEDEEKEKKYLELLRRKQVDGFIIASSFHEKKLLEDIKNTRIPLVMLTQDAGSLGVTSVSVDDFTGGFEATSHLLSLGHQNIVIIAEQRLSSKMRIYGFREAYETNGYKYQEDMVIQTTASIENGKKSLEEILKKKERPSAIFACNDLIAIGVIQGAREHGINIPVDMSVVGFDNTILATTTVPSLTTVAQPINEMGKKVVDVIVSNINNEEPNAERILFKPKLMVRNTSGVCNNFTKA
ncbi:LacI family DNA-binding transcriptional regulator [Gracilibacillus salitolerans]|uniref:LacI family DNA-binding transcriptional regulator n=1 Tax=Gracilibacillus salitolerans TaxID=2663022 RepID=A0A5Q2TQ39_9BACI|nr:LacI family DNA-binding transcriptional regulator [Gracilibacillus salitolerans]QGH36946.1 LacI family DNA-binding transcriptional regulator [Gracilibacillus salitolerans]